MTVSKPSLSSFSWSPFVGPTFSVTALLLNSQRTRLTFVALPGRPAAWRCDHQSRASSCLTRPPLGPKEVRPTFDSIETRSSPSDLGRQVPVGVIGIARRWRRLRHGYGPGQDNGSCGNDREPHPHLRPLLEG